MIKINCFFIFEISGPCRFFAYEKIGRYWRILFLWFSVGYMPYKWTEFLDKHSETTIEYHQSPTCDNCGEKIYPEQKDVGHECHLHEWCIKND